MRRLGKLVVRLVVQQVRNKLKKWIGLRRRHMNTHNENSTKGDRTPDSYSTENKRKYHQYMMSL